MRTFRLALLDSRGADRFERVQQFIGADASGAFGILAGHEPMIVALRYGLARFLDDAGAWHYLALPAGILRLDRDDLRVVTVRYFLGDEPGALLDRLAREMAQHDSDLSAARQILAKIDRMLIRRLADLEGRGTMAAESIAQ